MWREMDLSRDSLEPEPVPGQPEPNLCREARGTGAPRFPTRHNPPGVAGPPA
jgi:hypothetical protein